MGWMAHRKWKEAKQLPGTAGPGNMLGCCLISFISCGPSTPSALYRADIIIGGFRRFSAEGAGSAVCFCLSRFRVRQNFQCRSLLCMWFTAEPSQFSVGQTAPSLTCSIMEKPHTGLKDCLNMLLSCFRKRMSDLDLCDDNDHGRKHSTHCAAVLE